MTVRPARGSRPVSDQMLAIAPSSSAPAAPIVPSPLRRTQARPYAMRADASLDLATFGIYISSDVYGNGERIMRVAKWGNSLAVRLPAAVVEALDLKDGDDIELTLLDEREFGVTRK